MSVYLREEDELGREEVRDKWRGRKSKEGMGGVEERKEHVRSGWKSRRQAGRKRESEE